MYGCIERQLLQICLPAGDTGALLLSDAMDLYYYQVTDLIIIHSAAPTGRFLHRFPAAVRGLCVCASLCVCVCVLVGMS